MKNVERINRKPKTGTSRAYRRNILEPAEKIMPEERKLEDFMSFTASLARQIIYFNFQNEPDGTWSEFFENDPAFVLADILSFDSKSHQAAFEEEIKKLQYLIFIGEESSEKWHEMMHKVFDIILRADGWLTAFKQSDQDLVGFRKELWSIKGELQSYLDKVIELHHQFEKNSGHHMDLTLKSLEIIRSPSSKPDSGEDHVTDNHPAPENIDQLIEIYRSFSNSLSHVKKAANNYFERSLKTGNHEPHAGLFISFLRLFLELSANFDDYTGKHRAFYYDELLRLKPETAVPDKAILTFKVEEPYDYVHMPEGTKFPAGKDENGNEILFETTSPIALNRAVISGLRTFLLGDNDLYKPSGAPDGDFVTGVYVADRTDVNFSGNKWPLLGEDQTGLLKQNRTMEDALVGFAISAPAFYLKEGLREVSLKFHFDRDSYGKFIKYITSISRGMKEENIATDEEAVNSMLLRLFMDGFILDYTSDDGWVEKSGFFIDVSTTNPEASEPELELSFKLEADEPPVTGYNREIHGLSIRKPYPVIRLRLNPEAHLYAYSVVRPLKILSTSCDIRVSGLKDLVVYNDVGLVNSEDAFYPFGPVPVKNSWMAVSHPEAFNKNIDNVSLELTWEQLPDNPYGFHGYYSQYPNNIDNQSFNIRLFSLEQSRWKSLGKKSRYLFRTEQQVSPDIPDPLGRLDNITRLENISLVNSDVVDRPDLINKRPEYTSKTERGFLKVSLTSPEQAFGHKQYPLLISNTFLQNSKVKKLKQMVSLPEEPYTPLLRRITMDYRQSLYKSVKEPSERGGFDLYHIRTFDESVIINADLQDDTEFLFPGAKHQGQIIFEVTGSNPPQVLSLFFQLRDTTNQNTYARMPSLVWEYQLNDEWNKFSSDSIIRDGTNNFMNSGIVVLDLPEALRHDTAYFQSGIIKIRACTDENAEIVGHAIGVSTQAAEVRRVLENDEDPMNTIPAGSISEVKGSFKEISEITQRLPSFGGKPPENTKDFIINTSELLKHRGKAVLSRDFERLILQNFDEVRMVNCLPGISTQSSDEIDITDPGKVLIAVIPDARRYPDTSPFRPRFSAGKLDEMRTFLKNKTSEFAEPVVRNPRYERITIRCIIRLKDGIEKGLYLKKLNNDISRYISPWCYDPDIEIEFAKSIDLTDIRGFIYSRPYVEMVTGLSAVKITMKGKKQYELFDTAVMESDEERGGVVIEPTKPWSVMVTDRHHAIRLVPENDPEQKDREIPPDPEVAPEPAGISNLKLGDSFIISEGSSETSTAVS